MKGEIHADQVLPSQNRFARSGQTASRSHQDWTLWQSRQHRGARVGSDAMEQRILAVGGKSRAA